MEGRPEINKRLLPIKESSPPKGRLQNIIKVKHFQ